MIRSLLHFIREQPSKAAWWLLLLFFFGMNLFTARWTKGNIIRHDIVSYYSYLPAAFIYHDIGMSYCKGNAYFSDKIWGEPARLGMGPVQKYTIGMSVMYAPFFFAGHAHAHAGGWTPDGYTQPYRFWLQWGMLLYVLVGLWFLRLVLLRYFSEWSVALTLIALASGTNLAYYTIADPAMPHATMFMLVSMLMWWSIRFYESPTWRHSLALGLTASMITLVRPNHLLLWSIPVLVGIASATDLRARLQFWWRERNKILIWPLLQALLLLPQLLYWKHATGHWLHYSYGNEGFYFASPAVWQVLFSFRKGLLIYTPVMALGFVGLWWLRRYAREWSLATPMTVLIAGYVIAAWWCWWYGGSFGMRAFIDLFPLLALGMAALFERVHVGRKRVASLVMGVLVGGFCMLNGFQIYQYHRGLLHFDAMSARAYVGIWGRTTMPEQIEQWLDRPDYGAALRGDPE